MKDPCVRKFVQLLSLIRQLAKLPWTEESFQHKFSYWACTVDCAKWKSFACMWGYCMLWLQQPLCQLAVFDQRVVRLAGVAEFEE